MRILIVGGAGEVGKNLTSFLARRDHEVSILDRAAALPEVIQALPVKYIRGDITDARLVNEVVKGTDAIIHLAWSFADDAQRFSMKISEATSISWRLLQALESVTSSTQVQLWSMAEPSCIR